MKNQKFILEVVSVVTFTLILVFLAFIANFKMGEL
mgnify:CR=1 FL=1